MQRLLNICITILALLLLMHLASMHVLAKIYTEPPYIPYLWRFEKYSLEYVYSIAWSPDGNRLAAGGSGGTIVVLTTDGEAVWGPKKISYVVYDDILTIAWSPDDSRIVVGTEYGYIIAISADKGEALWQISLEKQTMCGSPEMISIAWTSNHIIAVTTSANCTILIISPDGDILWIWSVGDYNDIIKRYGVYRASISPRGTEVALVPRGYNNYYITVFSLTQGKVVWENKQCFSVEVYGASFCYEIRTLAWSRDGSRIAVGLSDGSVTVVSALEGRMLWRKENVFSPTSVYGYYIDWSPDGSKIAVIGDVVRVVSLVSGEVLWRYYISPYSSVAWSPTGGAIAVGVYCGVYLFPVGNYTILYISSLYVKTKVVVSDGVNTSSVVVDRGRSIKYYLDSGDYIITFYLVEIPPNYVVLGSLIEVVDLLAKNPIEMTLTANAEIMNITAPTVEEFLTKILGKLVVRGSPGTSIRFVWGSGDASYKIPAQGVLELYLMPNIVYSVYAMPPRAEDYVFIGDITAGVGEVLELNLQSTTTTTAVTSVSTIITIATTSIQSSTTMAVATPTTIVTVVAPQTTSSTTQSVTTVKPISTGITTSSKAIQTTSVGISTTEQTTQPGVVPVATSITKETPTTVITMATPVQVVQQIQQLIASDYLLVLIVVAAIVAIVAIVAIAVSRHKTVIKEKTIEREREIKLLQSRSSEEKGENIATKGEKPVERRGSSIVKELEILVEKIEGMLSNRGIEDEWQSKCHELAKDLNRLSTSLTTLIDELEKRGEATPDVVGKIQKIHRFIDTINDYAQSGCRRDSKLMNSLEPLRRHIVELHGLLKGLESIFQ